MILILQYLVDLKNDRAKIIIADINDQMAQNILCQAFKLQVSHLLLNLTNTEKNQPKTHKKNIPKWLVLRG